MSTPAFDTHKAIKVPKDAGFEETQAEAAVSTIGEAIGENVATKEHITAGISYFTAEIAAFEARLYRHLWLMAAGIVGGHGDAGEADSVGHASLPLLVP